MKSNTKLRDHRITSELTLELMKVLFNFKSREHPRSKIKRKHRVRALLSILTKEISRLK